MAVIEPDRIPLVAAAVAMLALAALVAWVDLARRSNRAFAAFLTARGLGLLIVQITPGSRGTRLIFDIQPYFSLAILPLIVYFASVYPARRGPLGRPGAGWFVVGAIALLELLYLVNHEWYWTIEPGQAEIPILQAAAGYRFVDWGPLFLVTMAAFPALATMAVLFVYDYSHSTKGSQRTSHFLVASGFVLSGLFDGSRQVVTVVGLLRNPDGFPFLPWGWAVAFLPLLSLVGGVAGLAYIILHRFPRGDAEHLAETRMYAVAAVALATGLLPLFLRQGSDFFAHPATLVFLGVWRLALPVLVSYALLRYALFDLDLKVRTALAGTVGALAFAIVYFVVSELLENVVGSKFGFFGGFVVAILFFIAARPMERYGQKVAGFLMPNTKIVNRLKGDQAAETYRQEFLLMQEDGIVTKKERRALELLRERLGIRHGLAKEIEGAAVGRARPRASATGKQGGRQPGTAKRRKASPR